MSKSAHLLMGVLALAVGSVLSGQELTSGAETTPAVPRFAHAYAWPACAPSDGPAVEIVLTDAQAVPDPAKPVPVPYLRLQINKGFGAAKMSPGDYPVQGLEVTLSFAYAENRYKSATSGSIHITKVNKDNSFEGSYDAVFDDGTKASAPFTAKWVDRKVMCG
jgi:hypothetical protein